MSMLLAADGQDAQSMKHTDKCTAVKNADFSRHRRNERKRPEAAVRVHRTHARNGTFPLVAAVNGELRNTCRQQRYGSVSAWSFSISICFPI